jgi:hypothetical protein
VTLAQILSVNLNHLSGSSQDIRETMCRLTELCMKLYILVTFNPLLMYVGTLTCKQN